MGCISSKRQIRNGHHNGHVHRNLKPIRIPPNDEKPIQKIMPIIPNVKGVNKIRSISPGYYLGSHFHAKHYVITTCPDNFPQLRQDLSQHTSNLSSQSRWNSYPPQTNHPFSTHNQSPSHSIMQHQPSSPSSSYDITRHVNHHRDDSIREMFVGEYQKNLVMVDRHQINMINQNLVQY